mmetsp:Transcript_13252/g.2069  ORF Transcript_13252/g.2069 Transcript_13252/m.2069 type:complete len:88 (+) Transcript_13252:3913-4176(+)
MESGEKERVEFLLTIKAKGNVEKWLFEVQQAMIDALIKAMKDGKDEYETKPRKDWVLIHPGQVVTTVALIMWCSDTEASIRGETNSL